MKKLSTLQYFISVKFFCMKYIGDMLPYVRLIPKKVTQLTERH